MRATARLTKAELHALRQNKSLIHAASVHPRHAGIGPATLDVAAWHGNESRTASEATSTARMTIPTARWLPGAFAILNDKRGAVTVTVWKEQLEEAAKKMAGVTGILLLR